LADCEKGYKGCNGSIAAQSFRELLVNFTWVNETNHLRLDLEDCMEKLEKNTKALAKMGEEKEEIKTRVITVEGSVFLLESDNR
jgi:hypothetical protein